MALSLTVAPSVEPVTVAEAKAHCKVDHAADDDYFTNFLIPSARRWAESYTGRAFLSQTFVLKLRGFGCEPIVLPRPPLASITSIAYTDGAGASATWAASSSGYQLEQPSGEMAMHASIRPAYGVSYPSTRDVPDSVVITYVAGYGAAATAVPVGIKHGVLMLIEDMYRQRGSEIVGTIATPTMRAAESLLGLFMAQRMDLRFD